MNVSTENMGDIPEKTANQTLVDYTESLTDWYIERTSPEYRKEKGQYFTPQRVSEFMVKQFENINKKEELRILDPGAGVGIFESAICEYMKLLEKNIKISFDLYESDINILHLLRINMRACKESMACEGFKVAYRVFGEDFILSNASILNNQKKSSDADKKGYDLVIANPPYYKLKKGSIQEIGIKNIMNVQPNIYSLFMILSAKSLKNGGQMSILTPRSYCSGLYFRNFRKQFFEVVKPYKIHLFNSRKEVFKKYNVLQENMILTAIKTSRIPENILVSVSEGTPDENEMPRIRSISYDKIIVEKNDDILMRIPTSELEESIASCIDKLENNLGILGFKVSTGPVVPFRSKDFLLEMTHDFNGYVPLIWMHNIVNGVVKWPLKNNKPVGIRKTEESRKILVPNKNYILIKRFSSKEGKQRINAGIYLNNLFNSDLIGIENHVNYIYKKDGELGTSEAHGIVALLNSRLYNKYFQITNGSTQVNATELRNIPLPSLEIIRRIGDSIRNLKREDGMIKEQIILKALKTDKNIENGLITNG